MKIDLVEVQANGLVARGPHSPPFSRRVSAPLIKRSRSLSAQTGWLVKRSRSHLTDIRVAQLIFVGNYQPPRLRRCGTGSFLEAQTPLLEKEGNGAVSQVNRITHYLLINSQSLPNGTHQIFTRSFGGR